jgi:hypothetical protein
MQLLHRQRVLAKELDLAIALLNENLKSSPESVKLSK